jgi:hypothetical protein
LQLYPSTRHKLLISVNPITGGGAYMQSNLANLSPEALAIISEAENKIASSNGGKVALVAYSAD